MDNKLPVDTFTGVMQLALDGCKAVATFMREALLEHTKRLAMATGAAGS
jgi:exosome complex component RRP41